MHLLRDLQKTTEHLGHEWSSGLKKLLEKTNQERNKLIKEGRECFEEAYILEFFREFDRLMILGMEENKTDCSR